MDLHLPGAAVGLIAGTGLCLLISSRPISRLLGARLDARTGRPRRASRLALLVRESGLPRATTGSVVGACLASAVVIGLLALVVTGLLVAALLAAIAAAVLPIALLRRRAERRRRALRAAWPDAIDQLVSAVRAGLALPDAISGLATRGPLPLREPFAGFEADVRSSGSVSLSLDRLQEVLADSVADRVIASLRIAREVGGTDLGRVLRTLSTLVREDARARGEIEARQSWTVSAARLAVAAPWVTLALLLTRPETLVAYRTPTGALVLVLCAVLTVAAYRAMLAIGRLPQERRLLRSGLVLASDAAVRP